MDVDFSTFTDLINHWINRKQNNQQVPAFQNDKTGSCIPEQQEDSHL